MLPSQAGGVDKQVKQLSAQQQADNEFRRASAALQQGRSNEARAGYEEALRLDPGHDAARQALAALLLENRQTAEAERALQEGLARNPAHTGFAMLLARLQVERDAVQAALDTLLRSLPHAGQQADYHGFAAALLQRMNRHQEAVGHYRTALQQSPGSGVWLMGLGISLQALQRSDEARDAYRRALESRALNTELQEFVRQRLKEL
jgi:MSHA biogenesis protein MshN